MWVKILNMLGPYLVALIHNYVKEELRCVVECKILISPEKLKRLATWCVHQASQLFTRLIIHKVLLHCCCINPRGLSTRCDMWHAADHMWCDMLQITTVKKGGNSLTRYDKMHGELHFSIFPFGSLCRSIIYFALCFPQAANMLTKSNDKSTGILEMLYTPGVLHLAFI